MIDCWFPLIHGQFGEDGQLQKQLEKTGLPYIGSDKKASFNCYDKILSREKANSNDIKQPIYLFFKHVHKQDNKLILEKIIHETGLPCFIKPSRTGSSIGISRVKEEVGIIPALNKAMIYDNNIIVEKEIKNCIEYEVAFIGNSYKRLSIPGTIVYEDEFYTTQAKYSKNSTQNIAVKDLNETVKTKLYSLTEKIIDLFNVKDLGRVDFFYDKKNDILYWNEINTIPGFTEKSMFPFLWKEQGLEVDEMIDLIIREVLH